jgi:tetratricopeptide (TPR) repeat protein
MNSSDTPADYAEKERAWLSWLQQQCDAVMAKCQLPSDRAATPAEMNSFFAGLDEVENACATAETAASQLADAGFGALADRVNLIRKDVRGARDVFKQPRSKEPGPLTKRMHELREEQRRLQVVAQNAAELVANDPARAKVLLADALEQFERVVDALAEIVPKLPSGNVELPLLLQDRRETRAQMLLFQALACARLYEFDAAQQLYQQALRELPQDHPQRAATENGLLQLENLRMLHRGYV